MKRASHFTLYLLIAVIALCNYSEADELISPTRTLEGSAKLPGRLTVVSEPPGLEVFLDGSKIGETPMQLKQVKSGLHQLRVKQSETDILVEPGGSLLVSLFKGSFITITQEEQAVGKQANPKKEQPATGAVDTCDRSLCKYGSYEDSDKPRCYRCYYGGWGTHICQTNFGLKDCRVEGQGVHSCEELVADLRAKNCCQEQFSGFSMSFILEHCGRN